MDSSLTRGSCQLLTEGCLFTPRNNTFLQLWKLTTIYNQIMFKKWHKTPIQLTSAALIMNGYSSVCSYIVCAGRGADGIQETQTQTQARANQQRALKLPFSQSHRRTHQTMATTETGQLLQPIRANLTYHRLSLLAR